MNKNINLGKIDENSFKESKAASIARFFWKKTIRLKHTLWKWIKRLTLTEN